MKPRFRLRANPWPWSVTAGVYWSCTVHFDRKLPSKPGIVRRVKHSGPCVTAALAIGEATLLWRKYSHA